MNPTQTLAFTCLNLQQAIEQALTARRPCPPALRAEVHAIGGEAMAQCDGLGFLLQMARVHATGPDPFPFLESSRTMAEAMDKRAVESADR